MGLIFTRRFLSGRGDSELVLSTGQLTCAAVQLALLAPLSGAPDLGLSGDAIASMLALGALGTGLVYVMFFSVVRQAGAATSSSVAYLLVVVSTVLGIVVLGESVDWHEPLGAAVIVLALGISQGHARLLARRAGSLRARSARRASRAAGR